MKELKRGDRVKFLNETGSGSVTRVIDRQMVMVRTDEGFEYPVLRSELINTSIDEAITREKDEKPGEDITPTPGKQDEKGISSVDLSSKVPVEGPANVFLAVEPHYSDEPVTGEADILIINDSPYFLLYHCSTWLSEKLSETISAGILEPDTKLIIGTEHLDDLFGSGRGLSLSYIPYAGGRQPNLLPVKQVLRPARDFMVTRAAYTENEFTDRDSWLVKIEKSVESESNDDLASRLIESITAAAPNKESAANVVSPRKKELKTEEVDLHIGEIADDIAGLTPGEIISMQLARFRTALDGAVRARQKKIVFIHGTGEGKLKHEIRRIIDREYPRCNYQDASFREYGYGATLVLIR